jgi:hypothetical protein
MPTYVELNFVDSDNRTSTMRIPVLASTITVPADLTTGIGALIAVMGGVTDAFLTTSVVANYRIIVEVDTGAPLPASSDIRNKWQMSYQNGQRISIPGRNTLGVMTTGVSRGELFDTALPVYAAFTTALLSAPPAGIAAVESDDGTTTPVVSGLRATSTTRVRPRV